MPQDYPWGRKPDMLTGYDNAGESFSAVLRDAERRLLLAGERNYRNLMVPAKLGDVELHTQHRSTYAEPKEKQRIVRAAEQVLQETVLDEEPEAKVRFAEALAAMRQEDERIFVVTLTGNICDFVYWNWHHGYTLDAWGRSKEWKRFRADARRRKIAAPELARAAYGDAIVQLSNEEGQMPDRNKG